MNGHNHLYDQLFVNPKKTIHYNSITVEKWPVRPVTASYK